MTDVPPLPPPPSALPPPGWYADPSAQSGFRWWDGNRWTEFAQSQRPVDPTQGVAIELGGQHRRLAGWWRRGVGSIIDNIILSVPPLVATALIGAATGTDAFPRGGFANQPTGALVAHGIVGLAFNIVAPLAYAVYFLRVKGSTLGMMALGLEAVDKSTGQRLTLRQTYRRALTAFILLDVWSQASFVVKVFSGHPNRGLPAVVALSAVSFAFLLLTYLWAAASANNQTLQDIAAGSVVVLVE